MFLMNTTTKALLPGSRRFVVNFNVCSSDLFGVFKCKLILKLATVLMTEGSPRLRKLKHKKKLHENVRFHS